MIISQQLGARQRIFIDSSGSRRQRRRSRGSDRGNCPPWILRVFSRIHRVFAAYFLCTLRVLRILSVYSPRTPCTLRVFSAYLLRTLRVLSACSVYSPCILSVFSVYSPRILRVFDDKFRGFVYVCICTCRYLCTFVVYVERAHTYTRTRRFFRFLPIVNKPPSLSLLRFAEQRFLASESRGSRFAIPLFAEFERDSRKFIARSVSSATDETRFGFILKTGLTLRINVIPLIDSILNLSVLAAP